MSDLTEHDNHTGITAVTVTYGDRWQYLEVLLRRLEQEALVHDVVVVDNASQRDIATACADAGFVKSRIFRQERNLGSAGGYKAGIEAALALSGDYIILYDDDVVTAPGSLEHLLQDHIRLTTERSLITVALMAYRESQHGKLVIHHPPLWLADHHFLGLNIFNFIPRHLSRRQQLTSTPEAASQNRGVAYAGFFFHRTLISAIGLPNSDFVVYYDDVEFTFRLLAAGGEIWLDIEASCEDMINNYSMGAVELPFLGFLLADSDVKIYYLIRNRIYFDRHTLGIRSLPVVVNMSIFMYIILLLGCITFRFKRLATILRAVKDGYCGKLGLHPDYLLK